MSFLHSSLRTIFIKYYEIRRRYRGWHRRITYRPGITFNRKIRMRIVKLSVACLILWHIIGVRVIEHGKKKDENWTTPLAALTKQFGKHKSPNDNVLFHYPTALHEKLGLGKPKPDVKVEMFKEEYPMDEW